MGVYENVVKVFGPYQSKKDLRLRVVLENIDGSKTTVSYPKYLMEIAQGRYLDSDETVDHIDGDYLNNNLDNLRVLKRNIHAKNDVVRNMDIKVSCQWCGRKFTIKGSTIKDRNRRNTGCFCSKRCTGLYGVAIQNGYASPTYVETLKRRKGKLKSLNTA